MKGGFYPYVRKPGRVLGKKLKNGDFLMKSGKYQWVVEKDAFKKLYEPVRKIVKTDNCYLRGDEYEK